LNTLQLYLDEKIQAAIKKGIGRIRGIENREDATQEAYHALSDEGPVDVDEAVECVKRAIHRFRMKITRESRRDAEGWVSNSSRRENVTSDYRDEWMHFAVHYLGIDNDEYDESDSEWEDTKRYDTADFPVRQKAFY
jgi:hypothetical protein